MKRTILVIAAAIGFSSIPAQAFPIAASGAGAMVIVASTDPIIATYEGNSAAYSNNLYMGLYGGGTTVIFNNQSSVWGSTVNLGSYAIGTELVFRLQVTNTGYDYYTGPGARNPDGFAHARVETVGSSTLVSFEDLYGGPFDFNDLSFSFSNTRSSGVPDGLSTAWSLLLCLAGMVHFARRRHA